MYSKIKTMRYYLSFLFHTTCVFLLPRDEALSLPPSPLICRMHVTTETRRQLAANAPGRRRLETLVAVSKKKRL
ncbi:hypothetical protein L210DRAFT_3549751, partial [Boletus edulis BED1]